MKYKILFSALAILFVFLLASGTAFAAPIAIRTTDDLMRIDDSDANLGLDYILMEDIDFKGKTFTPIGTDSTPFHGTFDGNNKTISNITFSTDKTYVGLFGFAENADFNRVILNDVNLKGDYFVGGLLGKGFNVSIKECSIKSGNSLINGNSDVGGLVGELTSSSSVSDSYATSDIIGNYYVGGLIGDLDDSVVSNSYATGNVSEIHGSLNFDFGGLVGDASGSSISNSYAIGNVNGSHYVGGLIGDTYNSSVSDSYATGNVAGGDYVGGFVGELDSSSVHNSYAVGNAVINTPGNVRDCNISGFIGTLSVFSSPTPTITDSFYIGAPKSNDSSMGFFVNSAELKNISTFRTDGRYVSQSWDISPSPNSNSIWYIKENSYPQLQQVSSASQTADFASDSGAPTSQARDFPSDGGVSTTQNTGFVSDSNPSVQTVNDNGLVTKIKNVFNFYFSLWD